jgi:hypothetical protein
MFLIFKFGHQKCLHFYYSYGLLVIRYSVTANDAMLFFGGERGEKKVLETA